jgi:hypothetical protein
MGILNNLLVHTKKQVISLIQFNYLHSKILKHLMFKLKFNIMVPMTMIKKKELIHFQN